MLRESKGGIFSKLIAHGALIVAVSGLATGLHAQGAGNASTRKNEFPLEISRALQAPDSVTLYSLEPWARPTASDQTLRKVKVLGKADLRPTQFAAAIGEFQAAVTGWDGLLAACFCLLYTSRCV